MPLFASLSKTEAFSDVQDSSSKRPAFPPTAVQFYSTKSIHLASNSIKDVKRQPSASSPSPSASSDASSDLLGSFAPLTYDAVTILTSPTETDALPANGIGKNTNANANTNANVNPNLGIWNCRINTSEGASTRTTPSGLLKACLPTRSNVPTFVLTLDLDEQDLNNQVHPIMSNMIENIIDYCTFIERGEGVSLDHEEKKHDDNDGNGNSNGEGRQDEPHEFPLVVQGTTHLSQLKSAVFGKAPLNDDSEPTTTNEMSSMSLSSSNNNPMSINLIICGIFTQKKELTYREKQAANLVSYHLQKYASDLNCTLCFLTDDGSSGRGHVGNGNGVDSNGNGGGDKDASGEDATGKDPMNQKPGDAFRPKGMTVAAFGKKLRKVCVSASGVDTDQELDEGETIVNVGSTDAGDGVEEGLGQHQRQDEQEYDGQQPSYYGPYDYDIDLINSVLLRGAGCPGVWNANTDNLWVALPPSTSSPSAAEKEDSDVSKKSGKGDQEWLEKLADSVNAYVGSSSGGGAGDGKSVRSSMDQTVRTTRTSANSTVVTKKKVARKKPTGSSGDKKDSQDVQDFFAGLLNK